MIINQSGGGKKPTGTKNITNNGTHNVTDYASANVNVPTTAPQRFLAFSVDSWGKLIPSPDSTSVIDLSGVKTMDIPYLKSAYYNNSHITGEVNWSDLTSIQIPDALSSTFSNTHITSLKLSSLTRLNGTYVASWFCSGCTDLATLDLSALAYILGSSALYQAFNNTKLSSVSFPALHSIQATGCFNRTFANCQYLTSLSFPALTSSSFGSYTDQFNNMLSGVTGCTVHFPSNLQSVIGSWSDVTNGFGGTNTTVLFDLPATA